MGGYFDQFNRPLEGTLATLVSGVVNLGDLGGTLMTLGGGTLVTLVGTLRDLGGHLV